MLHFLPSPPLIEAVESTLLLPELHRRDLQVEGSTRTTQLLCWLARRRAVLPSSRSIRPPQTTTRVVVFPATQSFLTIFSYL